jgi:hypothetical protein
MPYIINLLVVIIIEIYLLTFYKRQVTNKQTLEINGTEGKMYYNRLPDINKQDTNLLVFFSGGPTLGYRDYVDQTITNINSNKINIPWFVYKNPVEFPLLALDDIEKYVRYLSNQFPFCKITFVSFCFGTIIATHIANKVKDLTNINKIIAIDAPHSILDCLKDFKDYWFRFDIYIIKSIQKVMFKRYPELTKKFSQFAYLKGYDFLIELINEFFILNKNKNKHITDASKLLMINLDLNPNTTVVFIHSINDPIANYKDNINFINNNLEQIKFKVKHVFNNVSHHCNGMYLYDNSIQLYQHIMF